MRNAWRTVIARSRSGTLDEAEAGPVPLFWNRFRTGRTEDRATHSSLASWLSAPKPHHALARERAVNHSDTIRLMSADNQHAKVDSRLLRNKLPAMLAT